jgi:small acid-soluble spore protein H (minor)
VQIRRAEEIIASPEKIEVLYNENPVWLEDIVNNEKAYVTVLGSCKTMEVPVSDLVETGKSE